MSGSSLKPLVRVDSSLCPHSPSRHLHKNLTYVLKFCSEMDCRGTIFNKELTDEVSMRHETSSPDTNLERIGTSENPNFSSLPIADVEYSEYFIICHVNGLKSPLRCVGSFSILF
jgi:hypothetical protein